MENHHQLQKQQQPTQQQSDQLYHENEEMWTLFEDNSFFSSDDEDIEEDKEDIDVSINENKIDINRSIVESKENICESTTKNKENISISIEKDRDIDNSTIQNKEVMILNSDEDKLNCMGRMVEDQENIDICFGKDNEIMSVTLDKDKEAIMSIKDKMVKDYESIAKDKEDIDKNIIKGLEDNDESRVKNKQDSYLNADENKGDTDENIIEDEDIDMSVNDENKVEDKKDINICVDENKDIDENKVENKEDIHVSLDENKTDIDDTIGEVKENIENHIVEEKEDMGVSLDENNEDIDMNMVKDKEELEASILKDKENIDKDEHTELINESIDEDKEDIWNLFEELYQDDSESEDISDASGKKLENECKNSTKMTNKDTGDKTQQDVTDVNIEKNFNITNDVFPESCNERTPEKMGVMPLVAAQTSKTSTTVWNSVKRPHPDDWSEFTTASKQMKQENPHGKDSMYLLQEIFTSGPVNFYMKENSNVNIPEYECFVEFKGKLFKGDGKSNDVAKLNAADGAVLELMKDKCSQKEILSEDEIILKKNLSKLLLNKEHIREHNGRYSCNLCLKSYIHPRALFDHVNGEMHIQNSKKNSILESQEQGNSHDNNDKYFCHMCSLYIPKKGMLLLTHIKSKKHQLATMYDLKTKKNLFEIDKEYIREEDGKYVCSLCSVSFVSESLLNHLNGKLHELNTKDSLTDDDIEVKNALDKGHIKDEIRGRFDCNLCTVNGMTYKFLMQHLKGERHKTNVEIDTYWGKESLKEFLQLNKKYVEVTNEGQYQCKVDDCSRTTLSAKGLHKHVKQENHVLKVELSEGHIQEEGLGKYFCNLCSTTLLNTKSLLEHAGGKKHKNNLQLSSKGNLNQTHENNYFKVIEKEALLSSNTNEEENGFLSSMEDINLNCKNMDNNESKISKLPLIKEKLAGCEDPMVLEALDLGHLKVDTFGEFTCSLCDVSSTKLTTVKIHLKGKKHQLKAKELAGQENDANSSQTVLKDMPMGYFINMSGLPDTANEHDIMEFFSPMDIASIRFIVASTEEDLSSHVGEADVGFLSQDDATLAMAKHLSKMDGNVIHLTQISISVSTKCLQDTLLSSNPASLRIVVTESEDINVKKGTVIVLTADRATIILESRDYKKLKEINVNHNETVFYVSDTEDFMHQYFVRDLGSKDGTLLNGKMISPQGSMSEYIKVNHDDIIQCGLVTMVCHIHPSSSFCFDCEKETKIPSGTSSKPKCASNELKEKIMELHKDNQKDLLERSRKKELKTIRKKYGLTFMYNADQEHVPANTEYTDRANKRRKQFGSDNPYEKTEVAHTSLAISSKNKGFKMLASMGWKEGEGLGKDNSGILEPIRGDEVKDDRTGLGSTHIGTPSFSFKEKEKFKERQKILDITKERFYK